MKVSVRKHFIITAIALITATCGTFSEAEEWLPNGSFDSGLTNWSKFQKDASANVVMSLVDTGGEKYARLTVAPATPTNASMDNQFDLPVDPGMVCIVTATYRAVNVNEGRAKIIMIFKGGTSVGNGEWQGSHGFRGTTTWREERMVLTIPPDSTKLQFRAMIASGSGELHLKTASVRRVEASDCIQSQLSIFPDQPLTTPTLLHYGVDAPFYFPGLYRGSLPQTTWPYKRDAFVQALQDSGIGALRFPGGEACHLYLPQSVLLTEDLLEAADKDTWPYGHVPQWDDIIDLCGDAGLKLIYQLNTSFYVNESNQIAPATDSTYPRELGFSDGQDHISEAARALDRLFTSGVFSPGDVDYWQIGGNDTSLMTPQQYADIAEAYINVLKVRDPGRPICVTQNGIFEGVPLMLQSRGAAQYVTGAAAHYPYDADPKPDPPIATADYESFSRIDVQFDDSISTYVTRRSTGDVPSHMLFSVAETGVGPYPNYDAPKMSCSLAHALAFASNWPHLLSSADVDMAVYHDLESITYGIMSYHTEVNLLSRRKRGWKNAQYANTLSTGFTMTPTSQVFSMLRRFENTEVFNVIQDTENALSGLIASRFLDRSLFFAANTNHEPVYVTFAWPVAWPTPAAGTLQMIEGDSIYPISDEEYRRHNLSAPLPSGGNVNFFVPPRSIILFEWSD